MATTTRSVKLSISELYHLLSLLHDDKDAGSYYGNLFQYNARAERIEGKVKDALAMLGRE